MGSGDRATQTSQHVRLLSPRRKSHVYTSANASTPGEPDAGDPPVRFGGRGRPKGLLLPLTAQEGARRAPLPLREAPSKSGPPPAPPARRRRSPSPTGSTTSPSRRGSRTPPSPRAAGGGCGGTS